MQYHGRVLWFNNAKGFGFLKCDNGPDVFVHYSSIVNSGYKVLREGDEVEFNVTEGPRGPQAVDVTRLGTRVIDGQIHG